MQTAKNANNYAQKWHAGPIHPELLPERAFKVIFMDVANGRVIARKVFYYVVLER